MKKPDKRETVNLFFSAFLILAFIVCAHFFTQFTANLDVTLANVINIAIYVVFGLLVFYATRVGDGKPVKRFSVITLLILVLPSLYILIASVAKFMPLNNIFAAQNGAVSVITALAAVALGYGLPYTFISGFELAPENAPEEQPEVLEGGVEADVLSGDDAVEENGEKAVEEAAEEPAEEAVEEAAEEPAENS
ncbi:MAG: hypothetical protein IJ598_09805 [Ruminococcus sp.]|nr:hypothetical protein [Ruminococcus sp.]